MDVTGLQKDTRYLYTKNIVFIGVFFFIFGFVTWMNGALIPYLKLACQLHDWETYLVTFSFYIAYTVMAIPSGKLIQRVDTVRGMQIGLLIMAFGCLMFIPAALSRQYMIFLTGLFMLGTGLAVLQVAVNPYVTLLGAVDKAAQRINIMGACNKFAGMVAPLAFGAIVLVNTGDLIAGLAHLQSAELERQLDALARRVIVPYAGLALLLVALCWCVHIARLPKINTLSSRSASTGPILPKKKYVVKMILGFTAIFCSVGAEVIAGDTIGNYGLYHNMDFDLAKILTSATLTSMLIGNVIGAFIIPGKISQERAFVFANVFAICMLAGVIFLRGETSVFVVAALGFVNAFLWPAIWPQTLRNLSGSQLHQASAILIMGIAGGAILPLVYGWFSILINSQYAYFILFPCYLYNIFYWYHGQHEKKALLASKL